MAFLVIVSVPLNSGMCWKYSLDLPQSCATWTNNFLQKAYKSHININIINMKQNFMVIGEVCNKECIVTCYCYVAYEVNHFFPGIWVTELVCWSHLTCDWVLYWEAICWWSVALVLWAVLDQCHWKSSNKGYVFALINW